MEETLTPEISLLDESLNKSDNSIYKLGIHISLTEITYCILDTVRNKYLAFEKYKLNDVYNAYLLAEKLEEIFSQNKWLTRNFKATKIIYINSKSTLVPVPLFDVNDQETYFNFNHTLDDSEDLYCDKLANLNAYNLYAVPTVIKSKLRELFDNFKLTHYLTELLETLLILNKNKTEGKKIFINVNHTNFDLILLEGNDLKYNNTFQYHTPEDFIYYVLFALQQLELNPENVEITLMGEINKQSKLYEVLYNYVRNISFIKRNDSFEYSYLFDKLLPQEYLNLLNLNLSE